MAKRGRPKKIINEQIKEKYFNKSDIQTMIALLSFGYHFGAYDIDDIIDKYIEKLKKY